MPVDECERLKGPDAIKNAEPQMQAMAELYHENEEGPFAMGKQVSYADFVLVGFLRYMQYMPAGTYDKLVAVDRDVFDKLLGACQPWLQRDDH